jgi:hypothetical protein
MPYCSGGESDLERAEQTVLAEVIELHPQHLAMDELLLRVAMDPNDRGEVERIRQAIRELRRSGLLRYRNDEEIVEATHATLNAYALLTA